jgi:hypothetical protein
MLSLESHRWSQLQHAYGSAADIPALLKALTPRSSSAGQAEPWFSIWSALAHQGDVFSASYAAVPHVVAILANAPTQADSSFFQFPTWIEICRVKAGLEVDEDLKVPYFSALGELPQLVAAASRATATPEHAACCMAAVAVAMGQAEMAAVALELTPENAGSLLEQLAEE